jgi:hypothetical protein
MSTELTVSTWVSLSRPREMSDFAIMIIVSFLLVALAVTVSPKAATSRLLLLPCFFQLTCTCGDGRLAGKSVATWSGHFAHFCSPGMENAMGAMANKNDQWDHVRMQEKCHGSHCKTKRPERRHGSNGKNKTKNGDHGKTTPWKMSWRPWRKNSHRAARYLWAGPWALAVWP